MFSLFLMRSMNFLVSTDRLLSCLPLPLYLFPLLLTLSSSSSSSSFRSYYNFGVGFLLIRLPMLVEYNLRIKIIISRSITLKNRGNRISIRGWIEYFGIAFRFIRGQANWGEAVGE